MEETSVAENRNKKKLKKINFRLAVKVLFCLVFLLFTGIFSWNLIQKLNYPIELKVCDIGYKDCQVIAKFKDRYDCEITNQKWGWYCDQTDKSNIKCQERDSTFATGFCD
jgi:hypothetical protein